MAPNAQSCRGSFFVTLPLFTQDLRSLSTEEAQSTCILTGSPGLGPAAWPWPAGLAGSLRPGQGDKPLPHSAIPGPPGWCRSCNPEACEDELTFQRRSENLANAVQMCVQRQITCTLKYASIKYNGKWWVKKNSDCSLDENHFTHWLEK